MEIIVIGADGTRHVHNADSWTVDPETTILTLYRAQSPTVVAQYRVWSAVSRAGDPLPSAPPTPDVSWVEFDRAGKHQDPDVVQR